MPSVITAALGFVLLAAGLAGAKSNSIGLGAPAAKTGEYEKYADLLKRSGKLAGRTDKSGMLPYDKWSEKHFNRSHGADFSQWLQRSIGGRTSGKDLVPPLTRMCGVWVNHKYKVIFVRNRKAASTSIVIALGKPCEPGQGPNAHCMHKVHDADTFLKAGVTPEEAWKDYFVFGVSRNPWARAASGYDYAQRKDDNPEMYYSPERSASCKLRHYEFDEFCANPMSIALQSFKQGCPGWIGKMIHLEPAARCFQDDAGATVVDYIARYESLNEDFDEVINIINKRRSPGLEPLKPTLILKTVGPLLRKVRAAGVEKGSEAKQPELVQSSERHVQKYLGCGQQCVDQITQFYSEDVNFFQFPQ